MKRLLPLIIIIVLVFMGCAPESTPIEDSSEVAIDFDTGIHWSKFWKTEKIENSDYCVIPSEDVAIKIATAIYQELPIHTYSAQGVFYDEQDEVWVVEFYAPLPELGPMPTDQPTHSIALQKKDGKVLSIYVD